MPVPAEIAKIRANCPDKLFPNPRRIVTTHTPSGSATVLSDAQINCPITPLGANMVELWQTGWPSDNMQEGDPVAISMFDTGKGLSREDGIVLRVVDIPGGLGKEHIDDLHRLDYTHRRIVVLDNDEEVFMNKPGDVLVQRGTIHGWYNSSSEPARFYAVLIGSKKVVIDGKELDRCPPGV